jgi:hypothetical protein
MLVEGYRKDGKVKQRTLHNFGRLDLLLEQDPNAEEKIKAEANIMINQNSSDIVRATLNLSKERVPNESKFIGHLILGGIFERLELSKPIIKYQQKANLDYDLNYIMKALVEQRILRPEAKLATFTFQESLWGGIKFTKEQMDDSIRRLSFLKDEIIKQSHKSVSRRIDRVGYIIFFELSEYYVDLDIAPSSPNDGPDPIVRMGIVVDQFGIPITYHLFTRSNNNPDDYLIMSENVKKQFNLDRMICVGLTPMSKSENCELIQNTANGWIFSCSFKSESKNDRRIKEFILDDTPWDFSESKTVARKSKIIDFDLPSGKVMKQKILVIWDKKRADQIIHFRNNKSKKFDGMEVISTSEIDLSDDEILRQYHSIDQVYEVFRFTKTDFESSPFKTYNKAHAEAHFLTCFVAIGIMEYFTYDTDHEYTADQIIEGLNSMRCFEIIDDYFAVTGDDNISKLLEDWYGINWSKKFKTREEIESLRLI